MLQPGDHRVPDSNLPPPTVTDAAGRHRATVAEETGYGLVGIGGESRSGDANGEYIRVEAGGGVNTPAFPLGPITGTTGKIIENGRPASQTVPFAGFAESQLLGSQPNLSSGHEDSAKTPFRPDAPCERQQPPDLQASNGPAPEQTSPSLAALKPNSNLAPLEQASKAFADAYGKSQKLAADGKQTRASAIVARATKQWLHAKAKSDPQLRAQLQDAQKHEKKVEEASK